MEAIEVTQYKLSHMIQDLRQLRDDAHCEETNFGDTCQCERYDRIIDVLELAHIKIDTLLQRVADPKHSDGEGLAKTPQDVPDEYLSDGQLLDEAVELFEDVFGISVDDVAKRLRGITFPTPSLSSLFFTRIE